ncbi:MAG: arylsulfatase [Bryobacteraceae bacterium]|jgi:arylsulfatase A-like enzyme
MTKIRKLVVVMGGLSWLSAMTWAADVLPKPDPAFKGKIDPSRDKSTPDWPRRTGARKGAPNVVLILLDDVGFGATATFGGPVPTPALDQLAKSGLRYNRFHVNSLCSPTRAALLSGRNDHEIGFGTVVEGASGYPGYNSIWPKSAVSIAEVLKQNGYSTAAFGKWHNTPVWETNPAGPFDHWPTSLGFEYYYGFMGGADSQWHPRLYRNTVAVEPPATPAEGYHLTTDLVNDASRWLQRHDAVSPQKPFFLYFATGATHTPHHVAKEWIAKFAGQFDQGWDRLREQTFARQREFGIIPASAELTPRPKEMPAWDSLSANQRRLLAHEMEVYAAFLAQTDYEVGRLLANIKAEGHTEDTIVFYIAGDNGASAEGGPEGLDAYTVDGKPRPVEARLEHIDDLGGELFLNHYAAAWAWATNTPFQWSKQVASHLGGTRDPLIVSWPGHIKDAGGLRTQFHHVTDIAPTLYELAGVELPDAVNGVKQLPLEGVSMVYSFDHPDQPSAHKIQYFEMLGNRGIYKDGWWAGSRHLLPWQSTQLANWEGHTPEQNPWELYNLNEDYSQAHNLAERNPEKLKELQQLFDSEARRNNVYPLAPHRAAPPTPAGAQTSFVYHAGVQRIPTSSAPRVAGHAHRITADLDIPAGGAEGVILAQGGRYGGYTLYVKDGHVTYEVNAFGNRTGIVVSSKPLAAGKAHIVVDFTPDDSQPGKQVVTGGVGQGVSTRAVGPGMARLSINGEPAGETPIAVFGGYYYETFDIGSDLGTPVSASYASPFAFNGKIDTVKVEIQ